jgi:snurportin-1
LVFYIFVPIFDSKVDGLLFYHKRTHYVHGRSPLVGWLKVHMVPEILGIDVDSELTTSLPRVDKTTLIKNNLELKDTTDDKTAEERAQYESSKASVRVDQMDVEKTKSKGRRGKGNKNSNQVDKDSSLNEGEESVGSSPMEVSSKSRRRRRGKNKKEESMVVVNEEK